MQSFRTKTSTVRILTVLVALFVSAAVFVPCLVSASEYGVPDSKEFTKAEKKLNRMSQMERGDEGFWSFALSTLLVRFVGIFIVLGVLQVVMQLSGRFFVALEKKMKQKAEQAR